MREGGLLVSGVWWQKDVRLKLFQGVWWHKDVRLKLFQGVNYKVAGRDNYVNKASLSDGLVTQRRRVGT